MFARKPGLVPTLVEHRGDEFLGQITRICLERVMMPGHHQARQAVVDVVVVLRHYLLHLLLIIHDGIRLGSILCPLGLWGRPFTFCRRGIVVTARSGWYKSSRSGGWLRRLQTTLACCWATSGRGDAVGASRRFRRRGLLDPPPVEVGGVGADEDFVLRPLGFGGRVGRDKLEALRSRARRCRPSAYIPPTRDGFRLVHVLSAVDIILLHECWLGESERERERER